MFRSVVVILSVLSVCVSAQKLCGSRYEKLLNQMCAFAKETQPCLHGVSVQDRVRTNCCQYGCSADQIKQACCFTNECLSRCYPGKGYRIGGVY